MGADKQDPRIRKILNDLEVEIDDADTGYKVTLKGINGIREFVEEERDFWEGLVEKSGLVSNYFQYWKNRLNDIENFENSLPPEEEHIKEHWKPIQNHLVHAQTPQAQKIFYSKTPQANFIYDLYEHDPNQGDAGHNYLIGKDVACL